MHDLENQHFILEETYIWGRLPGPPLPTEVLRPAVGKEPLPRRGEGILYIRVQVL